LTCYDIQLEFDYSMTSKSVIFWCYGGKEAIILIINLLFEFMYLE